MTYTVGMERLLFQQWGLDVDCDDYSTLIEFLNSEENFRTFRGLFCFLQKRHPEIISDTAAKYIEKLCEKSNVPVEDEIDDIKGVALAALQNYGIVHFTNLNLLNCYLHTFSSFYWCLRTLLLAFGK